MAARSLSTLTAGLFDYAGLFPPASLDMRRAAEMYARARQSGHAEMLARIVCPATKLHKLSEAAAVMMPGTFATSGYREHADVLEPWGVSAVIDGDLEECIELIEAFDEHHSAEEHGLARVETIELKAKTPAFIDEAIELIADDVSAFFEVPSGEDCRGYVAALAGGEAFAKIRCGGVTPGAIPPAADVADFVLACRGAGVAFKATAGLHHPIRAEQNLTYDDSPPRAVMHGFINLWMAASLVRIEGVSRETVIEVLEDTNADSFSFTDDGARWRDHELSTADLARARETFSISIGSCSFDEPVDDLQRLGWL